MSVDGRGPSLHRRVSLGQYRLGWLRGSSGGGPGSFCGAPRPRKSARASSARGPCPWRPLQGRAFGPGQPPAGVAIVGGHLYGFLILSSRACASTTPCWAAFHGARAGWRRVAPDGPRGARDPRLDVSDLGGSRWDAPPPGCRRGSSRSWWPRQGRPSAVACGPAWSRSSSLNSLGPALAGASFSRSAHLAEVSPLAQSP
jgi:hypothetical protein